MSGPSDLVLIDGEGDRAAVEKRNNTYAVGCTDTPWIFTTDGVAMEEKTAAIQGTGVAARVRRRPPSPESSGCS